MVKLGILSDTHGYISNSLLEFFKDCPTIIHAGDIGSREIIDTLSKNHLLISVYGNIDGTDIRKQFPEFSIFNIEGVKILVMHIGGYPPKYNKQSLELIKKHQPDLFVAGHSHILRVMYDKEFKMLYINPGAAGKFGFHTNITAIRLEINGNKFENLEVYDLKKTE